VYVYRKLTLSIFHSAPPLILLNRKTESKSSLSPCFSFLSQQAVEQEEKENRKQKKSSFSLGRSLFYALGAFKNISISFWKYTRQVFEAWF
jgi:hypothetical protein